MKGLIMSNYNVLILMATYNGEKYLRCQIDSILNQNDVNIYLYVADDCSTDSTVDILEEYKNKYNNIDYYVNEHNKRFTYNFIDLIFNSKKINMSFDYYALADQDDYWEENKIIEAIKKINTDEPTLYCSNLKVVDENLNFTKMMVSNNYLKKRKLNYNTYIFQNIGTGCTMVFNKKMYERVLEYYPKTIYCHDYWLMLVAAYTSNIIYDYNGYIKYRQHGNNQIGASKGVLSRILKNLKMKKLPNSHLCEELLIGYKTLIDKDKIKPILYMANYKRKFSYKLKLIFGYKYKRKNRFLNDFFKLLFNRY